jgi:hypothetical protein
MVAAAQQAHTQQQYRRHAAGGGNRGFSAFQCGQAQFHAGDSRVADPGVGVAVFLIGKALAGGFGIGLHKTAGQVQRFRVFAVLAAFDADAYRQRVTVQVFR